MNKRKKLFDYEYGDDRLLYRFWEVPPLPEGKKNQKKTIKPSKNHHPQNIKSHLHFQH